MRAPWDEAKALQRPLPDDALNRPALQPGHTPSYLTSAFPLRWRFFCQAVSLCAHSATVVRIFKPKLQADLLTRPVQRLMGMPWTIPNLVLHDKPVSVTNMRTHGRRHVFVNCGNPDCYHNVELDVSGPPDNVTYGDLQPRMLCTVCDHRGADVGPSWLHHA